MSKKIENVARPKSVYDVKLFILGVSRTAKSGRNLPLASPTKKQKKEKLFNYLKASEERAREHSGVV